MAFVSNAFLHVYFFIRHTQTLLSPILNFMSRLISSYQYEDWKWLNLFINMIFKTIGDFCATPHKFCSGWNRLKFPYHENLVIFFVLRFVISRELTQRITMKLRVSWILLVVESCNLSICVISEHFSFNAFFFTFVLVF